MTKKRKKTLNFDSCRKTKRTDLRKEGLKLRKYSIRSMAMKVTCGKTLTSTKKTFLTRTDTLMCLIKMLKSALVTWNYL